MMEMGCQQVKRLRSTGIMGSATLVFGSILVAALICVDSDRFGVIRIRVTWG